MAAPWSVQDLTPAAAGIGANTASPQFGSAVQATLYPHAALMVVSLLNMTAGGPKPTVTPDPIVDCWQLAFEDFNAGHWLFQVWVAPNYIVSGAYKQATFTWDGIPRGFALSMQLIDGIAYDGVDVAEGTRCQTIPHVLFTSCTITAGAATTEDNEFYCGFIYTAGNDGTAGPTHVAFPIYGFPDGSGSQFDVHAGDPETITDGADNHIATGFNSNFAEWYGLFDEHALPLKTAGDHPALHTNQESIGNTAPVPFGVAVLTFKGGVNTGCSVAPPPPPPPPGPCAGATPSQPTNPSFAIPDPCSGQPIQSFLYFNGQEVANGARTLAYMALAAAGDCQPKLDVSPGCPCWIETAEAFPGGGVFVDPATDHAPWYDATIPESAEFLGVLIDTPSERALFDTLAARTVTPKMSGLTGGSVGPLRFAPRTWKASATLVAATCAGMEYGRRWLADALIGSFCDPCDLGELRGRASCPPCDGSANARGEWFVYDVGLTAGPTYKGPVDPDCCCVEDVEFELTGGNPYLYQRPYICKPATSLNPDSTCSDFSDWFCSAPTPLCCKVFPPTVGVLGAIVQVYAGGVPLSSLAITTVDGAGNVLTQANVTSLPAGAVWTMNSARRTITIQFADGSTGDGTPYLSLPDGQGVPWVEVGDCDQAACVCAGLAHKCGSDSTATVSISLQLREA